MPELCREGLTGVGAHQAEGRTPEEGGVHGVFGCCTMSCSKTFQRERATVSISWTGASIGMMADPMDHTDDASGNGIAPVAILAWKTLTSLFLFEILFRDLHLLRNFGLRRLPPAGQAFWWPSARPRNV